MIMDNGVPIDPSVTESSESRVEVEDNLPNMLDDVAEIFRLNPKLAEIGTMEQYIAYLATIFPDSQVKYILWHNSDAEFKEEGFKPMRPNFDTLNSQEGVYNFTTNRDFASRYGAHTYPVRLNVEKPIIEHSAGEYADDLDRPITNALFKSGRKADPNPFALPYDESLRDADAAVTYFSGEEYVEKHPVSGREIGIPKQIAVSVFDENQIYILGTSKDIEGFKQFVKQ